MRKKGKADRYYSLYAKVIESELTVLELSQLSKAEYKSKMKITRPLSDESWKAQLRLLNVLHQKEEIILKEHKKRQKKAGIIETPASLKGFKEDFSKTTETIVKNQTYYSAKFKNRTTKEVKYVFAPNMKRLREIGEIMRAKYGMERVSVEINTYKGFIDREVEGEIRTYVR